MKIVIGNVLSKGRSALLIDDGQIKEVGFSGEIPLGATVEDYAGALILPGFVDIHIHGGGGYDFVDMTDESFDGIRSMHRKTGTTTLCPTLTSCPIDKTFEFLEYYKNYKNKEGFARVHLEGPFLSPDMVGAQNPDCIAKPSDALLKRLLGYSDVICSMTVAPELEGALDFIKALKDAGIRISVGHSNADAKTLSQSARFGADKITHMFCATPKRYKEGSFVRGGFEERALTDDNFYVELIADGHHVCPECFEMAVRCKGIDKVIAISDAMRGACLEDATESYLGSICPQNRVIIEDGVAKLPDRSSFAGSVTCGEKMFRVLHKDYGFDTESCVKMLSTNPAKYIGLKNVGQIKQGFDADLVIIDDYKIIKTLKKGR